VHLFKAGGAPSEDGAIISFNHKLNRMSPTKLTSLGWRNPEEEENSRLNWKLP
jgi:hypothetical protein